MFDKPPEWYKDKAATIKYCKCLGGQTIQCDWRERVDVMQDIGKPTIEVNPLKSKYEWDTDDRRRKRSLRLRRDASPSPHDPEAYTDDIDDEEEEFNYGFDLEIPTTTYDWPTRNGLTESFARNYCTRILQNATSYSICNELLGDSVMEPLERCVDDIKVM